MSEGRRLKMETKQTTRTTGQQSINKIGKIRNDIYDIKMHLVKLFDAATLTRAEGQRRTAEIKELKKGQEEILKKLDKISSLYSDHEEWLSEIDNRVNDIERSMINRF
jgi:septation ring formation regulator EzrA